MSNKSRSVVGTLFVLVIALCAIFIVSKKTRGLGWLDTTEDKLYTLTKGTESILAKLDQKVTFKLFYAHEAANTSGYDFLLQFTNYYYYVRDLLRAYERRSGGKIQLVELDPRPFSDAEDEAATLQIRRFPLSEAESFYFGLAVQTETGGKHVLEVLDPQEQATLEYKLSEAIDLVSRTKKNKLGVLSSVSITGGGMSDYMRQMMAMQGRQPEQPWVLFEELRKHYEIVDVQADADAIPVDVDFLMVVHPKDLQEKALYAIDQYVVKGGKAMFFVDPHCFLGDPPPKDPNNPFGNQNAKQSSSLEKLLNAWGVTVEDAKFAGDARYALKVPAGGRASNETVRFPGFLQFEGEALNSAETTTSGLKNVLMLFAGTIRKKEGAGTEVSPLITTSAEGNTWTAQSFELGGMFGGPDFGKLATKFNKGVEKVWTAARVSGKFKSAFEKKPGADDAKPENGEKKDDPAEGPPKDGEKKDDKVADEKKADHVKEAAADGVIFVVADVDMLTDRAAYQRSLFGMSPSNGNSSFVRNCVEQLAGSADLINVRSRGSFNRPFTVVEEIERKADERTGTEVARINEEVQKFETELNEMNNQATDKNVGLLQAEAIEKQRKLELEIRKNKRKARDLQEAKLGEVKAVGSFWKNLTRLFVPIVVLIVGVVLAIRRYNVRKVTVLGGVS